jgi:dethiobiotin synthetase
VKTNEISPIALSSPTIPAMNLFVTGTDTGVGKTWLCAALVKMWRAQGRDVVAMKPIACGDRDDAEALFAAMDGAVEMNAINPVWLRPPVAPYAAAMIEERSIDLPLIRDTAARLKSQHASLVVEGVGGWMVPILRDFTVADFAVNFGFPVLVVAANRLGVLNHALLTVDAILGRGLTCAGVVLNSPQPASEEDPAQVTNTGILEDLLASRGVPFLGTVGHQSAKLPEKLLTLA